MTFSYLVDVKRWTNKTQKHSSPRAIHNYKIRRWWIRYAPNSYPWIQVCDWLTACHGVVDCTLANCCEKCEVPTYSRQKMSLQAAKFPTRPIHLPRNRTQTDVQPWLIRNLPVAPLIDVQANKVRIPVTQIMIETSALISCAMCVALNMKSWWWCWWHQ